MFDVTDAALVAVLQRDGRTSFQDLATAVGISREAARARVQRLLERREVRVVGIVAPEVLGLRTLAHIADPSEVLDTHVELSTVGGEIVRRAPSFG